MEQASSARDVRTEQRPERASPADTARHSAWSVVVPVALAIALGLSLPALIYIFARPLALLILAITIAAALSPFADVLERRMPRTLGVVLLYLLVVAVLVIMLETVVPTFIREAQEFIQRAPQLLDQARSWARGWIPGDSIGIRDAIVNILTAFQDTLLSLPMRAVSMLFDALIVLFLSLYLLISGPQLKQFTLSLVPARRRGRASRLLERIARAMGGYIRGAVISGAFVGALTWVALWIVGLQYKQSLAVAAALGEFIPYLGPLLAALPAVLLAFGQSPTLGFIVAGVYLGLQQVESYVITPNVMKSQTDLPPALVIFALVTGFAAGGLVGALAALPVFAALRVLLLAAAPAVRKYASRQP